MEILKRPTLVLNKQWKPINTVPVRQAITMLFGEWKDEKGDTVPKATVLDIDTWQTYDWETWSELKPKTGEIIIRDSRDRKIKAPEIIIVTNYSKIPKSQLNFNRRNLFRRDAEKCMYCGVKPGTPRLTIDHIIPRSKGGKTDWLNCVVCCIKCNQKKRNRTPQEANMKLIRPPYKPKFETIENVKLKSWEIFFGKTADDIVSEAYWTVPLI